MQNKILKIIRIALSFVFLWAFFDKTFGLGFSTIAEKSWINGTSPTTGFLLNATSGPFGSIFKFMAGNPVIDWMFMLGLLFVGITLLFNFYTRLGALAGILMMALMYLAIIPPKTNPVIDEHIIYALILSIFTLKNNRK